MALEGKRLKRFMAAETLTIAMTMVVHAEQLMWRVLRNPTWADEITEKEKAYITKRADAIHDARVEMEKVESRLRHT